MDELFFIVIFAISIILFTLLIFFIIKLNKSKTILKEEEPLQNKHNKWISHQNFVLTKYFIDELNKLESVDDDLSHVRLLIEWYRKREKAAKLLLNKNEKSISHTKSVNLKDKEKQLEEEKINLLNEIKINVPQNDNSTIAKSKMLNYFESTNILNVLALIMSKCKTFLLSDDVRLYFCADYIVVQKEFEIFIINYSELSINEYYELEDLGFYKSPDKNDEVAGNHWLHEKKRGGPDRRYSNNPMSYVVYRGVVKISLFLNDYKTGKLIFKNRALANNCYNDLHSIVENASNKDNRKIFNRMVKINKISNIQDIKLLLEKEAQEKQALLNIKKQEKSENVDGDRSIKIIDSNIEKSYERNENSNQDNSLVKNTTRNEAMQMIDNSKKDITNSNIKDNLDNSIHFDIYETVILLNGRNQISKGADIKETIHDVSKQLRIMALNKGQKIDKSYRSVEGIRFQMSVMLKAYKGENYYERKTPDLFLKVIEMYKNDRTTYDFLLEKALKMCETKETKKEKENNFNEEKDNNINDKQQERIEENDNKQLIVKQKNEELNKKEKIIENKYENVVDFNNLTDYAYTIPIYYKVSYEEKYVKTWKDVYFHTVKYLYSKYSDIIKTYAEKSLVNGKRSDFSRYVEDMSSPIFIKDGIFLETNLSAIDILRRIKILLDLCGEEYNKVVIAYRKKDDCKVVKANDNKVNNYRSWLLNNDMSASASGSYYYALLEVNDYAIEKNIWKQSILEISNFEEYNDMVKKLYSDAGFDKYNKEKHHRFSATLAKYSIFKFDRNLFKVPIENKDKNKQEILNKPIKQYTEELSKLIIKYFKYGFRLNSSMEYMRIRNYATSENIEIPDNNDVLKLEILKTGFVYEDKLYVIEKETIEELKKIIQNIFAQNIKVIFYEVLFDKQNAWCIEHNIYSEEIMKEIMQHNFEEYYFGTHYLSVEKLKTIGEAILYEVNRVWGDNYILTCNELSNLLPYIPKDRIKSTLVYSDDYIWDSEDTYLQADKIKLSDDEVREIYNFTINTCKNKGYISITDLPIESLFDKYYIPSKNAIYEAVYNKVLLNKVHRNGKIISLSNSKLDVVELLKSYCYEKDSCDFTELGKKVVDIMGSSNRQYAFKAAYEAMVRKDKNTFVSDKYASFDVYKIDNAILDIMNNKEFIAVKDISTFALFPICGLAWNHYVLESYCYRFSNMFRLELINFNDKNVGLIVKKEVNYNYNDMLSIIASNSDVQLESDLLGKYFFDNGYLGKSKYGAIDEIVEKAIKIREEK